MSDSSRARIAEKTALALQHFAAKRSDNPVLVGFDGFVDAIIKVVDQRHDMDHYEPVPTIQRFGEKVLAASGQSSNYELVTTLEKLGGNGPIMANAAAAAGLPVTYVGSLGHPALHPVFEPFARVADVYSFCDPGVTDALEFSDGKLMLGKHGALRDINAERIREVIGIETLRRIVGGSRLVSMVNWTMLTRCNTIWDLLLEEVLPEVSQPESGRRIIFIDLADPEKRTRADLAEALTYGKRFSEFADVVFGYNLKESIQVAEVLGIDCGDDPEAAIEDTAVALREALDIRCVVIHPRAGAAAADLQPDGSVHTAHFRGPLVKHPKLSTGAGDNFNAGFCLGLLADLPIDQALCAGTATSGFYVRNAASPSLDDLSAFCAALPPPE